MPRLKNTLFLLAFSLVAGSGLAQPTTSATYTVVFESTWSALTHPDGFPRGPHFSGLIGATHNDGVTFWVPGELASNGIESMAETGSKTALSAEVVAAINAGTAQFLLSGGGINPSPGSRPLTFDISPEKPFVTLVSMVAPSPDWFVGVHGLKMIEGDAWRDTVSVSLDVYDAGTDNGATYEAANSNTDPAQPIALLTTGSFSQNQTVGSFTFTRQQIVAISDEVPGDWEVIGPYPNPASGQFTLGVRGVSSEPLRVTLYDVTGRAVWKRTLMGGATANRLGVDVRLLPEGVYIVRLDSRNRRVTRPVVIAR